MSPNLCDTLVKSYINVCNNALKCNQDRFPFKQILGAARKADTGRLVEMQITEWPVVQSYVLTIENNQIKALPHENCKNCKCERKWKVSEYYLRQVASDPDTYVSNPAKINWEWLYGN